MSLARPKSRPKRNSEAAGARFAHCFLKIDRPRLLSMPADHSELGGRAARFGDFHFNFVGSPRVRVDSKCHRMASGGQRADDRRRVGRRRFVVDPRPDSFRRIELNANRTGIGNVDLALQIKNSSTG